MQMPTSLQDGTPYPGDDSYHFGSRSLPYGHFLSILFPIIFLELEKYLCIGFYSFPRCFIYVF